MDFTEQVAIIEDAIANNEPGFREGWLSSIPMTQALGRGCMAVYRVAHKLGYVHHPILRRGRCSALVKAEVGQPTLYVKPDHPSVLLAESYTVYRAYVVDQGYDE